MGLLILLELTPFKKGDDLIEDTGVTGRPDIAAGDQRQPEEVIRKARTDSAAQRWMPPVLYVSFHKLTARRPQQMFTDQLGFSVDQGGHVL